MSSDDFDDFTSDEQMARHFLGDVTVDLLSELAERIKAEIPEGMMESVEANVLNLQPHEMAALSLGQILGQLAIKHNDKRLFYGSVACMFFSGVTDGVIRPGEDISELMDFADDIWVEAQKDIDSIIADGINRVIEES